MKENELIAKILVHFRDGNPCELSRADYEKIKKTGMLWEFHPDAPQYWPQVQTPAGVPAEYLSAVRNFTSVACSLVGVGDVRFDAAYSKLDEFHPFTGIRKNCATPAVSNADDADTKRLAVAVELLNNFCRAEKTWQLTKALEQAANFIKGYDAAMEAAK